MFGLASRCSSLTQLLAVVNVSCEYMHVTESGDGVVMVVRCDDHRTGIDDSVQYSKLRLVTTRH